MMKGRKVENSHSGMGLGTADAFYDSLELE